jgi:superfamily II DNA/RNA helicase
VQGQREHQPGLHHLVHQVEQVQRVEQEQLALHQVAQLQGHRLVHPLRVVHHLQEEQVHKEELEQLVLLQVEQLQELHLVHQLRQLLAHRHKKDKCSLQL